MDNITSKADNNNRPNPASARRLAQIELKQAAQLLGGLADEAEANGFAPESIVAINQQATAVQRLSFRYASRFRSNVVRFRPQVGGAS